jgi:phosphoenolpyruvate carboxykinase (GTP)
MLPFCGYNMADYWGHWLKVGQQTSADKLPKIYAVNWFRKDDEGSFLWPGYGDNSRVLEWIIRRLEGEAGAVESPIGRMPVTSDLNLDGLAISPEQLDQLFAVSPDSWLAECDLTAEYFAKFGEHLPSALSSELEALRGRLASA